ncbi:MAG: Ig-like domain-containing protein [Eubacterium sp.]|nr:Ig-like domain-containing protein [Eubacterium sp.]
MKNIKKNLKKKRERNNKSKIFISIIMSFMFIFMAIVQPFSNVDEVRADEGLVTLNVSHNVNYVSKYRIISKINEIRKEAYNLGFISQYTPIKWSSSLEEIAMLRAAEVSIYFSHTRPNGKSWYSVVDSEGFPSNEEIIASPDEALESIRLWYGEKELYGKMQAGEIEYDFESVGHYEALISNQYIGIASFGCTVGELSNRPGASQEQLAEAGMKTMEITLREDLVNFKFHLSDVTDEGFDKYEDDEYIEDDTYTMEKGAEAKISTSFVAIWATLGVEGKWSSDNEEIARIDDEGNITALDDGFANITFDANGYTKILKLRVKSMCGYEPLEERTMESGVYNEYLIPDFAVMKWTDGSTSENTVKWEPLPDTYKKREGGKFELSGKVSGYDGEIKCSFIVNPAKVSYLNAPVSIKTLVGQCPKLPETIKITWTNGDETEEKVTWDADDTYYKTKGRKVIYGSVKGQTVGQTVYVVSDLNEDTSSFIYHREDTSLYVPSYSENKNHGDTSDTGTEQNDSSDVNGQESYNKSWDNESGNNYKNTGQKVNTSYSNEWVNGKWYDANGVSAYSGLLVWKCNSTGWWIEDTTGWYPVNCWQKIDGYWYYFGSDGYMASNEWRDGCWLSSSGAWEYAAAGMWNGDSTGWWFEDTSGWYANNCWQKINGAWYYFGSNGYMVTNKYIDGYWLGADGVCQ